MRLIDADALIHEIRNRTAHIIFRGCQTMITGKDSCNPAEWTRGYEQGVKDVVCKFEFAPTIDAEPVKRGRWVNVEDRPFMIYACSQCGEKWGYGTVIHCHYCPNCGARMDGEGDG